MNSHTNADENQRPYPTSPTSTPDRQTPAGDHPPHRICGVALDMDGLLFDTERIYFRVGDVVLQRRGRRFCHDLQARMMGRVGLSAIGEMIAFHELDDEPAKLLEESNTVYSELLLEHLRPMPGLDLWMEFLIRSGVPFGLATSSQRRFVEMILPTTTWHDQLAFILTGDDVVNGKPHPEMYLRAADALAISPEQMLVLEDSGNGCKAAVAAGATTVAIPNEHTRGQGFDGVQLIAESLADQRLWDLLAGKSEASGGVEDRSDENSTGTSA